MWLICVPCVSHLHQRLYHCSPPGSHRHTDTHWEWDTDNNTPVHSEIDTEKNRHRYRQTEIERETERVRVREWISDTHSHRFCTYLIPLQTLWGRRLQWGDAIHVCLGELSGLCPSSQFLRHCPPPDTDRDTHRENKKEAMTQTQTYKTLVSYYQNLTDLVYKQIGQSGTVRMCYWISIQDALTLQCRAMKHEPWANYFQVQYVTKVVFIISHREKTLQIRRYNLH